jgi:hypothetical protein
MSGSSKQTISLTPYIYTTYSLPIVKRLAPHGYAPTPHMPRLCTHKTRPIIFSLIVEDFGVKYVRKEHADHLIDT